MAMGFEALVEMIKRNKEQPTIEDEEIARNQCPYDAWPLRTNKDGEKSCQICGRIFR